MVIFMKIKSIIEILLALVAGYFTYYFYVNNEKIYAIFTLIGTLLFLALFIRSLFEKKDPYLAQLNRILKTYDSILVEVEVLPKVKDKKIVRTKYFKDLVNVQFEMRKPIYYLKDALYCEFFISDESSAYIYTLKRDEDYISKSEEVIDQIVDPEQEKLQNQINKEEDNKKYFLNDEERKDIIYNIVLDDEVKEEEEKKEVITAEQIKSSFDEVKENNIDENQNNDAN